MSFRLTSMTLQEIFIANLKKARKERGFSQMTLSTKCDTTSNYIGQIEMGRRIPSFEKIEEIAAALEIPSHKLFAYDAEESKEDKKPNAREYLRKMPAGVKKEIISHFVAAMGKDINASLDSQNY